MRIVIPELAKDTKVYDDNGRDITEALCIRRITITVGVDKRTTAWIECYADQVTLEIKDGKWTERPLVPIDPSDDLRTKVITNEQES